MVKIPIVQFAPWVLGLFIRLFIGTALCAAVSLGLAIELHNAGRGKTSYTICPKHVKSTSHRIVLQCLHF
jgi:hypothetical protein